MIKTNSDYKDEVAEALQPYWSNELNDICSLLVLHDHPLSFDAINHEKQISCSLSKANTELLKQLSHQSGTNLFTLTLAALETLLYRYTNQEEISISYPSFNVMFSEPGDLSNNNHNTKIFQTDFSGNPDFIELLQRFRQVVSEINISRDFSTETLPEEKKSENERGKPNSNNIIFSFTNTGDVSADTPATAAGSIAVANLGLFLEHSEEEGLSGILKYNTRVFDFDTINRMGLHFLTLLQAIISNPHQPISQLRLLTEEEQYQLLFKWNNSHVDYPANTTIHQLFEAQAANTPDATAVVFEKQQFTYKELNEHANQLAHYLISKGVKNETLVPLCLGRSIEMIVSILGILKAGGAYVPIDPEYPDERIRFMLEDTRAHLVITNKESRLKLQAAKQVYVIELNDELKNIKAQPLENPVLLQPANSLAYVIYTSGSTGQPKGVMIEHNALIDHCYGVIKSAGLARCTSFALFSPLVFDAGHSIIHSSLLIGASLHVIPKELITDGEQLSVYLNHNSIDCIKIVPSLWLSYANAQNIVLANKVMIFGGEAFSLSILNYLEKLQYGGDVYNHYGPTETTIGKCIYKLDKNKSYKTVPIGKPFSNTQLYVLDQFLELVPVGVEGELYIGGDGLAREYLNQPALTAEKFIVSPFNTRGESKKIYKTGDKVRWLANGNIEYLGRMDEQVKVRGYRIELGEIESVLLKSGLVNQGVVVARKDRQGNNNLVGYVVIDQPFNSEALVAYLKKKLPDYMVPSIWVALKSVPLTRNGKIDKKALPDPETVKLSEDKYVAPRNKTEATLVNIFQEVLRIEKIAVHDNFFELGGNSVQAVVIFSKIRKALGGTQLPLATLFDYASIEKLAVYLNTQGKTRASKSCLVPIKTGGPKSPLFCIHAGAGTVLFYRDLAENLAADQPVYGIQAKGLNGNETPHTKIEDMAAHYINEIKTLQPNGPYNLAGYCFGGIIAFEMAQQLKKLGEDVALLATINSRSPLYSEPPADNEKIIQTPPAINKISYHLNLLRQLSTKEKFLYPFERIRHKALVYFSAFAVRSYLYRYYLSRNLPLPERLGKYFFLETNSGFARAYRPKKYDGKMVVFRSPKVFSVFHMGWGDLVTGELKAIDIPGEHRDRRSILEEPFVQVLAKELNKVLVLS